MSVNKVILLGRLGQNPEVRHTPSGASVANFSLATNETWMDKNGQKQERTEWHRIVVWGKLADLCGQYLAKGRQAYVEGRLQTRKWQTKEGQDRYTTEIIADQMQMLGGRDGAGSNASYDGGMDQGGMDSDYNQAPPSQGQARSAPAQSAPKAATTGSGFDDFEDDIPF